MDVEQDDIVVLHTRTCDGLLAVLGNIGRVAEPLDHAGKEGALHRVVVGD